ncbi:branched-chain-amino-acid aminotransferase, cytosolic [Neocloeon triangulifer]|uniref:branched-chain-amino-acid aminotransferase, cytosolic n=1 Tax=Neocloeon triangulifer TaxID=2078957 RepID=UPI00286F94E2|nr:branched-chain-amino-acid aminotransferase, cytosolic [Neocloeon triangulifer]
MVFAGQMHLRRILLQPQIARLYHINASRWVSQPPYQIFKYSDLEVTLASPEILKPKPEVSSLQFGKFFTDHMMQVEFHKNNGGWQTPKIVPFQNISLHPAAKVFHYAVELFEGMKAYRGKDDKIRVFRPDRNMERMNVSAMRSELPIFDGDELTKCICRLISIDQEWVPHSLSSSLYIRPTMIGIDPTLGVSSSDNALLFVILCPVGPYFPGGFKPVSLLADPRFTRAWPGGCGDRKMGSNYAPTIRVQAEALGLGLQQVLWLFGDDHQLTEVGTMNIFVLILNENGERELVTPPLDGLILPGITRQSIIELALQWGEFKVVERKITMPEVQQLLNEKRLLELFGAGTACVVCPVSSILYQGQTLKIPTMEYDVPVHQRILKTLTDIQYGHVDHPWALRIDQA